MFILRSEKTKRKKRKIRKLECYGLTKLEIKKQTIIVSTWFDILLAPS